MRVVAVVRDPSLQVALSLMSERWDVTALQEGALSGPLEAEVDLGLIDLGSTKAGLDAVRQLRRASGRHLACVVVGDEPAALSDSLEVITRPFSLTSLAEAMDRAARPAPAPAVVPAPAPVPPPPPPPPPPAAPAKPTVPSTSLQGEPSPSGARRGFNRFRGSRSLPKSGERGGPADEAPPTPPKPAVTPVKATPSAPLPVPPPKAAKPSPPPPPKVVTPPPPPPPRVVTPPPTPPPRVVTPPPTPPPKVVTPPPTPTPKVVTPPPTPPPKVVTPPPTPPPKVVLPPLPPKVVLPPPPIRRPVVVAPLEPPRPEPVPAPKADVAQRPTLPPAPASPLAPAKPRERSRIRGLGRARGTDGPPTSPGLPPGAAAPDPAAVAQAFIDEVVERFGPDVAVVYIRSPAGGYRAAAAHGLSAIERVMIVAEDHELFSKVARTHTGLLISPVDLVRGMVVGVGGSRTQHLMVVPLSSGGACRAIATVGADKPFADQDLDELVVLANEGAALLPQGSRP